MCINISYLLFVVSPANSPNVCVSGETREVIIHISCTNNVLENVVDFGWRKIGGKSYKGCRIISKVGLNNKPRSNSRLPKYKILRKVSKFAEGYRTSRSMTLDESKPLSNYCMRINTYTNRKIPSPKETFVYFAGPLVPFALPNQEPIRLKIAKQTHLEANN